MEFPHGNINKRGTIEAIRKVFPRFEKFIFTLIFSIFVVRYDADCVMKNIFEIFDSMNTGKINQNEIMWVFSMAMNGTGRRVFIPLFVFAAPEAPKCEY